MIIFVCSERRLLEFLYNCWDLDADNLQRKDTDCWAQLQSTQAGHILDMDKCCAMAESAVCHVSTFQQLQMKCTHYRAGDCKNSYSSGLLPWETTEGADPVAVLLSPAKQTAECRPCKGTNAGFFIFWLAEPAALGHWFVYMPLQLKTVITLIRAH